MASDRIRPLAGSLTRYMPWLLRTLIRGSVFRIWAPRSPAWRGGGPHRLAICDLIPNLGDKVMIFPVLDALLRENPGIVISYFTSGAGRIIGSHPAIASLHTMESGAYTTGRYQPAAAVFAILRWWRRELRSLRFHTVVVLRGGVDPFFSHHLAWLLGGSIRACYDPALEPERAEFNRHTLPLFNRIVGSIGAIHEIGRSSEVLERAGLLAQPVVVAEPVASLIAIAQKPAAHSFLQQIGLAGRPFAIVAPGASLPRRAWPPGRFAEAARQAFLSRNWLPVIVGGPEVAPQATSILAVLGNGLDLTGKTSFEQLVAVSAAAQCFLGNDSGTAHIAGACGVPTLVVTAFASTGRASHHASPGRSHPAGPRVAVVQPANQLAPCTSECLAADRHCIDQIEIEQVVAALGRLLTPDASLNGRTSIRAS